MILAQTLDIAANVSAAPTWPVVVLAVVAMLTPLVPAVAAWLGAKARAVRAEAERDAIIEGVERANGNSAPTKLAIKQTTHERGVGDAVHDHVTRLTKRLKKGEE